jgi:poly(3-hydroxybutyrate) depolymerase
VIQARCSGKEYLSWAQAHMDGKICRVSACMAQPRGYEVNHHRLTVHYTGSGSVQVSLAHSSREDLNEAITKAHLHSRLRKVASGKAVTVPSGFRGERCAWLIVRTEGEVRVQGVDYSFWRGRDTLYGHLPMAFEFGGTKLPYRLMWPRNYDPTKTYPLVVSVAGSGGVGTDNAKNMEMVILARHLFTQYYHDDEMACFSLVPQILPDKAVPAPYWPKGTRGAPELLLHPDWPLVNENGWFAQAATALVRNLVSTRAIPIDPDRVYFTGFSYGGKACWELLKADRTIWAAAMCGGGWPVGGAFSDPKGLTMERLKLEVQRYRHVPVLAFAGQNDRMLLGTRAVCKELIAQGGKATLVEIPNASHVASAASGWGNRKHVAWLFRQNRKANPKPGKDPFPGGVYSGGR